VTFGTGIIYSYKVAGPLHTLKHHLQMCADKGRLEPIKFRESNYIHDVAADEEKKK
jgi:hypothetical protein